MKRIFTFILLAFIFDVSGQQIVRGRIFDAKSGEPLAFANITYDKNKGVVSDFDGKFELVIPDSYHYFKLDYIGYQPKTVKIQIHNKEYKIYLKPSVEQLDAVVIDGKYVNPAIALMKKAINLKNKNNYQKKLRKYAFTKYMKFVIGGETDKIDKPFDTIYKNGKLVRLDSTLYKFKKELSDKYIWLMENIAKVNGENGDEKTVVIATRTAGLKQPFYELVALQISGQNVYDDRYKLLFSSYTGPFSNASFKTYRYEIDDTISLQNRPVIVVNYKNTKKPLISGKIYLDKELLAIAKFTLNTYKEFQFNAVYNFKYFPAYDVWFPEEVTMLIKKAEKKNGINIGGQIIVEDRRHDSIVITPKGDTLRYTRKNTVLDYMYARYKQRIFDIRIGENYPEKLKYNLEIVPMATKRNREFWEKMRGKTYRPEELRTYQFVDSAAQKENIEISLHKIKRILNGYYPVTRQLDLDLINLLDYNRYEGFRLQPGVRTNEYFSGKWQISVYAAYGFKDKSFKYSGSLRYKVWHKTQTYLQISYTNDLKKSAAFQSYAGHNVFEKELFFSYDKFFRHQTASFTLSHLITQHVKLDLGLSKTYLTTAYSIPFHRGRLEFQEKDQTFYEIGLELTPFSKYFLAPEGRQVLKDGYPKLFVHFEQSIPQWQTNPVNYYRIDVQAYLKKTYVNQNYTELYARLGWAPQDAGIDHLFAPVSNDYPGGNPLERFNIPSRFAFETMKDLEFIDNFLVTGHLQHTFTGIKIKKDKNMDIRLIGRAAFGLSYDTNKYDGIKSLDKIYYESGIEFRRLYSFMGLGFYYRLGAYAQPDFLDNLSLRLTIDPFKLFNE